MYGCFPKLTWLRVSVLGLECSLRLERERRGPLPRPAYCSVLPSDLWFVGNHGAGSGVVCGVYTG